jgi:hypothetical protein
MCGAHIEYPAKPADESMFLAVDLFTRLGQFKAARVAASMHTSEGTQYGAAVKVLFADATCRTLEADTSRDKRKMAETANQAYRSAVAAGGTVGRIAESRELCLGQPGQRVAALGSAEANDKKYVPPDYERWGLKPAVRTEAEVRRLIAALEPVVPARLDPMVPGQADTADRDALFQLGRAYLDLELATPDVARKRDIARQALAVFAKTYPAKLSLQPWDLAEVRFLAADLAWRLHEIDAVIGHVPVAIGSSDLEKAGPFNALAAILAGDAFCEKGGEHAAQTANTYYYNATRIGGAAGDIARNRKACGDPTMTVAELVREVQSGRLTLKGRVDARQAPVLVATASGSWPALTAVDKSKVKNDLDAALIVGVEKYMAVPGVAGAVKNATDWYLHFVNRMGIAAERVTLLRDSQATVEQVEAFAKKAAKDVRPGGTLWFVFIGHGAPAKDGRDGVLVGADAQQEAASLYTRSMSKKKLESILGAGKQRATVMLLDACFSGRTSSGDALIPGLQPLIPVTSAPPPPQRTTVISAGKNDEFAGPLPGLNRPAFSYLMLGSLRGWADVNKDGRITAEEAASYTRQVMLATIKGRSQTPELSTRDKETVLSSEAAEAGPDIARVVTGE